MKTVTNETLKAGKSWLTKESRKIESFTEEKIRKFSTNCHREPARLKNYTENSKVTVNNGSISVCKSAIRGLRARIPRSKQQNQNINIIQAANVGNSSIWKGRLRSRSPKIRSMILASAATKKEQIKQEKKIIKAKERQHAREKNIRKKKKNQIQNDDKNMLSYKEKTEILKQNRILERPKQLDEKIEIDEKILHDIFSEVDSDSFSDGEEFKAKYQQQYKDWDQSPKFKAALKCQKSIDPDIVFERVSPLNVEEVFKGREYKLRPRTSSADWTGSDALTELEELRYKEDMGYEIIQNV